MKIFISVSTGTGGRAKMPPVGADGEFDEVKDLILAAAKQNGIKLRTEGRQNLIFRLGRGIDLFVHLSKQLSWSVTSAKEDLLDKKTGTDKAAINRTMKSIAAKFHGAAAKKQDPSKPRKIKGLTVSAVPVSGSLGSWVELRCSLDKRPTEEQKEAIYSTYGGLFDGGKAPSLRKASGGKEFFLTFLAKEAGYLKKWAMPDKAAGSPVGV